MRRNGNLRNKEKLSRTNPCWNHCIKILQISPLHTCLSCIVIINICSTILLWHNLRCYDDHSTQQQTFSIPFIPRTLDIHKDVKPRVFGLYFDSPYTSKLSLIREPMRLPPYWEQMKYELYPSKRIIEWTQDNHINVEHQDLLLQSEEYSKKHNALRPYNQREYPGCIPMHKWQKHKSYPTCNKVHEVDLRNRLSVNSMERLVANGYFRDVYKVEEHEIDENQYKNHKTKQYIALKALRIRRTFDLKMYERHRMDSIVMERLSNSNYVVDIYAYCGMTGLFEFTEDGTLEDWIVKNSHVDDGFDTNETNRNDEIIMRQKLSHALDVANAITDLHTFGNVHGHAAIVHGDIHPTQFVWFHNRWKLNDFNRCHFMYWNITSNVETCPYYYLDYNAGMFRSPEEYSYSQQTEKIDVYSMGNIFFSLLTGTHPFDYEIDIEDQSSSQIKNQVSLGLRPKIMIGDGVSTKQESIGSIDYASDGNIINSENIYIVSDGTNNVKSSNPIDKILIEAINMCFVHDWRRRPRAREVRDFLLEMEQDLYKG